MLILVSCGSTEDNLTGVIGSEKAHFQGVSIGDKHQKVIKKVVAEVVTDNETGIACEFEAEAVSVAVRYEFDDQKLYSIQADLFFTDSSTLKSFEENIIARYNDSYGEMTENGGFFVWQENNQVEFTLADESIEFGQPKLSLTIYNFGY